MTKRKQEDISGELTKREPKFLKKNLVIKTKPEVVKIISYVEFISQIWKNEVNTKTWFQELKDMPKITIYSAYVNYYNDINNITASKKDFKSEKHKHFWKNMYNVICISNGRKQKRFSGKSRPYITFFSKDEIIKNVTLLNDELQIFTTLIHGGSSNEDLLISSNEESSKKNEQKKNDEKQSKKIIAVNNSNDNSFSSSFSNINNTKDEKDFNDPSEARTSSGQIPYDLYSEQDHCDDLGNEDSSDIDEPEIYNHNEEKSTSENLQNDLNGNFDYINLNELEIIDTDNDILVNKENRRKNDKERMINYKGDTIEENNNNNNNQEHEKVGEESRQEIDENILKSSQEYIKKKNEKEKTWGIKFFDNNAKNQNIFYIIKYNEKEQIFPMSTLKMLLELDPKSYV
jgi:hypothetical protein